MFRKRLREESGYSLVEVVVSILILAIAILPMAAMFDMGINSAREGGQYDKARALANLKMEEAKSQSFTTVRDTLPQAGNVGGFQYSVEKQFMTRPPSDQASVDFIPSDTDTGLIRVEVIVQWGDGNTYTTYGLVGSGQ